MKKLKFLFLSLFIVAFLAPVISNAQAVKEVPAYCNITLDDKVAFEEAGVVISTSGNVQLKATFDVSEWELDLKEEGTTKIIVDRLAVQVFEQEPKLHFTALDVKVSVCPEGIASVVYNWQVGDMDVDW